MDEKKEKRVHDLRSLSNETVVIAGVVPPHLKPGARVKVSNGIVGEKIEIESEFQCDQKCGVCCNYFYIGLRDDDAHDPEMRMALRMRGIMVIPTEKMGAVAVIKAPCPNLVRFNSDRALCSIYDKRPDFCRRYNCKDDPIMPVLKEMKKAGWKG